MPAPPYRPPILKHDVQRAAAVFVLAFGSILPVIIPFTFIGDSRTALRVSNAIALVLLFLAGRALGRYAAPHPWGGRGDGGARGGAGGVGDCAGRVRTGDERRSGNSAVPTGLTLSPLDQAPVARGGLGPGLTYHRA